MRELKIDVPKDFKKDAEEILDKYTSEISSSEIERNEEDFFQFNVTIDQENIDEITEELKGLDIKSGDLSIHVIEQESLIKKGVKTKGPSSKSILSSQEIYSKSQQASNFNVAQWSMIALSGGIAGIGISTNNLIVLIGAILLAPVLYPLAALSIGIKMGDRSMALQSSKTVVISILTLFICSLPVFYLLGGAKLDTLINGPELVLLSFFVGGAAMLTFISEYKEEMAGAALAVAIVPPAAFAAEAFSTFNFAGFFEAGLVLLVNILSAIISGYFILTLAGSKPLTDYKRKDAERLSLIIIAMTIALLLLLYLTV